MLTVIVKEHSMFSESHEGKYSVLQIEHLHLVDNVGNIMKQVQTMSWSVMMSKGCVYNADVTLLALICLVPSGLALGFCNPPSCMSSKANETLCTYKKEKHSSNPFHSN